MFSCDFIGRKTQDIIKLGTKNCTVLTFVSFLCLRVRRDSMSVRPVKKIYYSTTPKYHRNKIWDAENARKSVIARDLLAITIRRLIIVFLRYTG